MNEHWLENKLFFRGTCRCGWIGEWRTTTKTALIDAESHECLPPLKEGAQTGLDDGPPNSIVRHK